MEAKFIERIWNYPSPQHDIYQDTESGMYGECVYGEGHVSMWFDDIPKCRTLEQCREEVAKYDKWLGECCGEDFETETYIGMADHGARCYWRKRRILEQI